MNRLATIRKANAIISALLMLAFLAHGIGNGLLMVGIVEHPNPGLAHLLEGLCWIHLAIGVYLTIKSLRAQRESGASYPAENKRYLAIRISGLAIGGLMLAHMIGFGHMDSPAGFGPVMLIINICLVIAIAVHVICNVRPHLMSLGLSLEGASPAQVALGVLLAFFLLAFVLLFLQIGVR